MKNFKYVIGWAMLLMASVTSCKKDFLTLSPTDRATGNSIVSDTTLFEAFVTNRYLGAILQEKEGSYSPPGFGRGFEYAMWSSVSDESIYTNNDGSWVLQQGQLSADNTGMAGTLWARSYRSIRECNYALSVIDGLPLNTAHKNRLVGEIRFIRAFRYHDIIRNYGGAVLIADRVTDLNSNLQDPALFKRASLAESINYVATELDDAASRLPLNNSATWALGRATKGAALALKSRLLLYAASPLYSAATWTAAAAAAKAVIDLGKYNIDQGGYSKLFLNPNSSEIIFERLYFSSTAIHLPIERANGPNGYDAWGGNTPLQNLVDAYPMANGKAITDPGSGYDPQNPYVNRDPRFYATILHNKSPYRGSTVDVYLPGGKDSNQGPSNWNTSSTGYYLRKFMNDSYPIVNPAGVAGAQPWIYFRYAEILLNYAEAQNEAIGPDQSVYDAINAVRSRSSVAMPALLGLSQATMREAIKNERQIELAFEEHRYYDVRRWKIAPQTENVPAYGISATVSGANPSGYSYVRKVALTGRTFKDAQYWLPIPLTEIQASNGQLKQNAGY
ncbi:RagB/SusD family nutrient uptake outer membrane protein [Pedobacter sp. 22163]|uniref:RagB/SusD family nutrient uptake outer membrane protein n=1 Tax=Pedobacter sp. 22163 TaxID=3453883 RepID=UPI003F858E7E